MKDLDRNKVYSLEGIKKDEDKFNQLKEWLKKNDRGWTNGALDNINKSEFLYYTSEWFLSSCEKSSICTLTLFEEGFIPNTVIDVSQNGANWYKRVLLLIKNNKAICWENAETIEEAKDEINTSSWKYYRNIKPKTVLTKQQVADKFGLDINNIIIENE